MLADLRTWLFASPRRLVVVSLTVIILVFVAGSSLFSNDLPARAGTGEKGTGSTAPTDAAVPESGQYVSAAVDFVRLWSRLEPGQTQQEWQSRLTPLATEDYAQALSTTDTDIDFCTLARCVAGEVEQGQT